MFGEVWQSFKDLITPKSHAEAMVDEIYGAENKGLPYLNASPYYPTFSMFPDVIVKPTGTTIEIIGGAVEKTVSAVKASGTAIADYTKSLAIWLFAAAIVIVVVYALARK